MRMAMAVVVAVMRTVHGSAVVVTMRMAMAVVVAVMRMMLLFMAVMSLPA